MGEGRAHALGTSDFGRSVNFLALSRPRTRARIDLYADETPGGTHLNANPDVVVSGDMRVERTAAGGSDDVIELTDRKRMLPTHLEAVGVDRVTSPRSQRAEGTRRRARPVRCRNRRIHRALT